MRSSSPGPDGPFAVALPHARPSRLQACSTVSTFAGTGVSTPPSAGTTICTASFGVYFSPGSACAVKDAVLS
jgi:hypothetical protein